LKTIDIPSTKIRRPELLAPAGNWACAKAAVANGADAIYFGLPAFNARMRAENFSSEDLPDLMDFLHEHGVRGYVTMNTLIFPSEMEDAERQLRALDAAGVDAVIVQDIGLARLVRAVAPNVALHASTQMTITSPEGLALVHETIGLDLAVLARENSIREMRRFKAGEAGAVPLEVFVHGALCVAYSGQCLTSESLGQRSANRGECAQACRMPYELVVDGETRDLGDRAYLLSPQDLAAIDQVQELAEAGIASFKIEGRLKSPEYVAAVTRAYRKAIDDVPVTAGDRYAMEMTFSRGFTPGWMHGVNHQELVPARFGKKRGAFVGRVTRIGGESVELVPEAPLKAGDGIVFDTGGDTDNEQGGSVYEVREVEGGVRLFFRHGQIDFRHLEAGDRVWKTSDPALERELRGTWSGKLERHHRDGLRLVVSGKAGEAMVLEARGRNVRVESSAPLAAAEKHALDKETLTRQLGRLGETRYALESVENHLEGEVMLPLSALNRLRRDLVERLDSVSDVEVRREAAGGLVSLSEGMDWPTEPLSEHSELAVLCRTMEQIEAALEAGVPLIHVDFEDIRRYGEAVARVRVAGDGGSKVLLATPRIQKPGEAGYFKLIDRAKPDGVLIRNLGAVAHYRERSDLVKVGDFSLNIANALAADYFLGLGLDRLTVSYDLAIGQVIDLLGSVPSTAPFELTIHQHMPMFHMEHCVFCAFMSKGTDYTNCGRPCEKHKVQLRDRVGMLHTLAADVGCRNTLFNGKAQTGARFFKALHGAGLRHFRVELLDENREESREVLRAYGALLRGEEKGENLWQELKATSKLGVTVGTLG
jgi:putative protease